MTLKDVIYSGANIKRKNWHMYYPPDALEVTISDALSEDWEVEPAISHLVGTLYGKRVRNGTNFHQGPVYEFTSIKPSDMTDVIVGTFVEEKK
jgi:hypothetical protein